MNEIDRIRCLPERDWHEDIEVLTDYLTERLKTPQGTWRLHEHQAAALADLHDYGGLIYPAPVGFGKSLVALLGAVIVGAKRPLLLVPGSLKDKTEREARDLYSKNWRVPKHFHIQTYEMLSRKHGEKYLNELKPDYVFCDEAHALKNSRGPRWRKLRKYTKRTRKAGQPVFLGFGSGTFFDRATDEFMHLLRAALGDLAPVPKDPFEAREWSDAMSARLWGERPDPSFLHCLGKSDSGADDVTRARQAFGDRLARTPGIIVVTSERPPYGLEIHPRWVHLPGDLDEHFERLRSEWKTPDEHPFEYPTQLWKHARELACGFYYRPNPRPPESYLDARRSWTGFRNEVLAHSKKYYTPGELADAIREGAYPDPAGYLEAWSQAQEAVKFDQEAVWLDETMLLSAAEWLEKYKGICWVEHLAFASRLRELTGIPVYGQGAIDACTGKAVMDEKGPLIATLACATGQNLQYNHHRNLIVSCIPTHKMHEQLIGRTHRSGQREDTVYLEYSLACKEQFNGFWQAHAKALGNVHTGVTPHAKLVIATNLIPTTVDGADAGSAAWR